jgi:mono/diheme cytochrome c family protein
MKRLGLLGLSCAILASGCHYDMWVQPKEKGYRVSEFHRDNRTIREEPKGVVAFGEAKTDTAFHTGYGADGKLVREFPTETDADKVKRGQERYRIYCTPCHGELGDGKGMITQRGLAVARPVPTYHTQRLRELPVGHFFDVITNGYGVMFPQGARITPEDRWAIVAYVRALQKAAAPDEPLGGLDLPAPAAAPAPAPAPQAEVTVQ